MSGGSRNYTYYRIEEEYVGRMYDPEINALMKDVAGLAHDVEWYDSGDYGEETYRDSVREFKKKWFRKAARSERLKSYIDEEIGKLRAELIEMIGEGVKDGQ